MNAPKRPMHLLSGLLLGACFVAACVAERAPQRPEQNLTETVQKGMLETLTESERSFYKEYLKQVIVSDTPPRKQYDEACSWLLDTRPFDERVELFLVYQLIVFSGDYPPDVPVGLIGGIHLETAQDPNHGNVIMAIRAHESGATSSVAIVAIVEKRLNRERQLFQIRKLFRQKSDSWHLDSTEVQRVTR